MDIATIATELGGLVVPLFFGIGLHPSHSSNCVRHHRIQWAYMCKAAPKFIAYSFLVATWTATSIFCMTRFDPLRMIEAQRMLPSGGYDWCFVGGYAVLWLLPFTWRHWSRLEAVDDLRHGTTQPRSAGERFVRGMGIVFITMLILIGSVAVTVLTIDIVAHIFGADDTWFRTLKGWLDGSH